MKIKLHHLNLCSMDIPGMEAFYRSVLDLTPEPSLNGARDTTQGYAAAGATVRRSRGWPEPACRAAARVSACCCQAVMSG
jgi:hypothetical protein